MPFPTLSVIAVIASTFVDVSFELPSSPMDLVMRQNGTDPNGPLAGWTFVGCFTDNNPASRTLLQATVVNPAMTPELCMSFCSGTDFPTPFNFAGVEFTDECYCDFDIQGTASQVDSSLCTFPCGGDSTLVCGGAGLISVFQNNNAGVGPIPANKASVVSAGTIWNFDGCFDDAVGSNSRSLLERFSIAAGVTIETCTATCAANGFNISGLEFGQECWCGSQFSLPIADITAPLSDCSLACDADHTELCGAASRLSVYIDSGVNGM